MINIRYLFLFLIPKRRRKMSWTTLAWPKKSDNLQYNMLGRWDKRLIDQASDVPSIIFIISYRLRALKTLYLCKIIRK